MTRLTHPLKWHGGEYYLARRIVVLMPPHLQNAEPYAGGPAITPSCSARCGGAGEGEGTAHRVTRWRGPRGGSRPLAAGGWQALHERAEIGTEELREYLAGYPAGNPNYLGWAGWSGCGKPDF